MATDYLTQLAMLPSQPVNTERYRADAAACVRRPCTAPYLALLHLVGHQSGLVWR